MQENKENCQKVSNFEIRPVGDRFIPFRNASFENEENELKMLDNSVNSEEVSIFENAQYKGMLVTQLYKQKNAECFAALGKDRIDNSIENQISSSFE